LARQSLGDGGNAATAAQQRPGFQLRGDSLRASASPYAEIISFRGNALTIETRSLPTLTHVLPPISTSRLCPSMSLASRRLHSLTATPRSQLPVRLGPFYVAHPIRSIVSRQLPLRSTATLRRNRPCRSSHSLHSDFPVAAGVSPAILCVGGRGGRNRMFD
jgi:hypothetical protein